MHILRVLVKQQHAMKVTSALQLDAAASEAKPQLPYSGATPQLPYSPQRKHKEETKISTFGELCRPLNPRATPHMHSHALTNL